LVSDERWGYFCRKREQIEREMQRLQTVFIRPDDMSDAQAERVFGGKLGREYHLDQLLRRPDVTYQSLMTLEKAGSGVSSEAVAAQVEVQIKYAGYIERQKDEVARQQRHEDKALPINMDYTTISGLSNEVQQKLSTHRPATIGQASRISGITPAAISILLIYLKKCVE
ncbi:MAG TPA: tRNA uridine-5-carboxymethylaminomethyl(34) synthesis enzyme MnmG, partial [Thiothrix sp.]|nr:tRNA uridine-5-carboxymethylaminomethyl(34) synthesis enzyme MnmG [Thiothrix sp.]